jgi:hypothetical protein
MYMYTYTHIYIHISIYLDTYILFYYMYIFLYILRFCSRILLAANGRAPCSIAGALQMAPRSMASLELKAPCSLAPAGARAAALAIQKCSFRNSHAGPGVCRHKMALLPTLGTHFTCFTGKKQRRNTGTKVHILTQLPLLQLFQPPAERCQPSARPFWWQEARRRMRSGNLQYVSICTLVPVKQVN